MHVVRVRVRRLGPVDQYGLVAGLQRGPCHLWSARHASEGLRARRALRATHLPGAERGVRSASARGIWVEGSLRRLPQVRPQRDFKRIQGAVQRCVHGLTHANFGLARKIRYGEPATAEVAYPDLNPEVKIWMRQTQFTDGRRHTSMRPLETDGRLRALLGR